MTHLPNMFIKQALESTDKLLNISEKVLSYFNVENKEELIQKIYDHSYTEKSIQAYVVDLKKRRNQNKKRWVNSAIKEYNNPTKKVAKELHKEFLHINNYYQDFGESQFKKLFNKNDPYEIINERQTEIKKWSEDTNSFISNYAYIKDKTKSQIKKSFEYDISIIIGELMEKYDGEIGNMFVEKPYTYVDNPIFSDKKGNLPLSDDVIETDEKSLYKYNDYEPSPEYRLRTLVPKEYTTDKRVRYLDEMDDKIFDQVMKYRSSTFATQRKIFVNIGNIVKELYASDSIKNYKLVESRLMKMLNSTFTVYHKEGSVGFGIFDFVNIDYNNNWSAEITVGEIIYQEYLNKQTIRMYRDVIDGFELPLSRRLTFILQKERLASYSRREPSTFIQEYDYSFFSHKLRLESRNKRENYKKIETSLSEIIKDGIGVNSYSRTNNKFYIEYIPFSTSEMQDLIHSNWKKNSLPETNNNLL